MFLPLKADERSEGCQDSWFAAEYVQTGYTHVGMSLIDGEVTGWGNDHPGEVKRIEKAMTLQTVLMK